MLLSISKLPSKLDGLDNQTLNEINRLVHIDQQIERMRVILPFVIFIFYALLFYSGYLFPSFSDYNSDRPLPFKSTPQQYLHKIFVFLLHVIFVNIALGGLLTKITCHENFVSYGMQREATGAFI